MDKLLIKERVLRYGTDLQLIKLNLFFNLMEEYMSEDVIQKKLDTPSEIYRFLKPKLAHLQVEKFYGVLLNAKLKLIDAVEISSGELTCRGFESYRVRI